MSAPRGFVSRFLHFWRTRIADQCGRRLGIAVSGGLDSGALAVLIHRLRRHLGIRKLVLIHLDHGIRSAAQRKLDLAAIRRLARRLRAPLLVGRAKIRPSGSGLAGGIEAAGRAARFSFFRRAVRRHHLDGVVLAHHLDDRIETFFLFLLRGGGSRGLSSPRERESIGGLELIRPLLPFTRDEIRRYGAAERVPYHEDETNRDRRYLRNRLRHDLIPLLKDWHPGFHKAMTATLQTLESEDAALSDLAAYALQSATIASSHAGDRRSKNRRPTLILDRSELRMWPPAVLVRVLQSAERGLGGSGLLGGHENLTAASHGILGPAPCRFDLPAGFSLRIDPKQVILRRLG